VLRANRDNTGGGSQWSVIVVREMCPGAEGTRGEHAGGYIARQKKVGSLLVWLESGLWLVSAIWGSLVN
jgi:hypothetical protein